jgi:opacity protein-like surface antigen
MMRTGKAIGAALALLAGAALLAPASAADFVKTVAPTPQIGGKPGAGPAPSGPGPSSQTGIAESSYFGLVTINPRKGCNSFDAGMFFHGDGTASFSFNGGAWEDDRYNWTQQGDTLTLTIPRGETWRLAVSANTLSGTYDDGTCTGTMTLTRR